MVDPTQAASVQVRTTISADRGLALELNHPSYRPGMTQSASGCIPTQSVGTIGHQRLEWPLPG